MWWLRICTIFTLKRQKNHSNFVVCFVELRAPKDHTYMPANYNAHLTHSDCVYLATCSLLFVILRQVSRLSGYIISHPTTPLIGWLCWLYSSCLIQTCNSHSSSGVVCFRCCQGDSSSGTWEYLWARKAESTGWLSCCWCHATWPICSTWRAQRY